MASQRISGLAIDWEGLGLTPPQSSEPDKLKPIKDGDGIYHLFTRSGEYVRRCEPAHFAIIDEDRKVLTYHVIRYSHAVHIDGVDPIVAPEGCHCVHLSAHLPPEVEGLTGEEIIERCGIAPGTNELCLFPEGGFNA